MGAASVQGLNALSLHACCGAIYWLVATDNYIMSECGSKPCTPPTCKQLISRGQQHGLHFDKVVVALLGKNLFACSGHRCRCRINL